MESCESQAEVRRYLGACEFYHIWIPHYAHIADPLYDLLRKGKRFEWKPAHTCVIRKLKKALREARSLKKLDYKRPVVVTIDKNPIGNRMGDQPSE